MFIMHQLPFHANSFIICILIKKNIRNDNSITMSMVFIFFFGSEMLLKIGKFKIIWLQFLTTFAVEHAIF